MTKHLVIASAAALFALAVPIAHAAPAVVVSGEGCGLFDGNGSIVFTTDTKRTATQSNNNNAKFTCKATVAPSTTGHAVRYDFASTGLFCGILTSTGFQFTDQWHQTVSASGEATLTCHVTGKP